MTICAPITTSAKSIVHFRGCLKRTGNTLWNVESKNQSASCSFHLYTRSFPNSYTRLSVYEKHPHSSITSLQKKQRSRFWSEQRISVLKNRTFSKIKGAVGSFSWLQSFVSSGLLFGLLICYSSPQSAHAQASMKKMEEDDCDSPYYKFSHGKKVYTGYSIIGIPGDGRCLFRAVAHGACLCVGKPAPSESLQRELADDLRTRVADEFIKRRQETEWFVEGDFDTYVKQIRMPHVWGGEPELFMASHVLKMPITVYMYDKNEGGLISIAEYGQEYGKENLIRVLYHGFGHYDALLIPGRKYGKSKL